MLPELFYKPQTNAYVLNRLKLSLGRLSRSSLAIGLVAGLLLTAGCSNNPYPPGESTGSVRYVGWSEETGPLDPTVAYSLINMQVIAGIYPCFYKYDHLKTQPYVLDLYLGAEEPTRKPAAFATIDPKTHRSAAISGEEWTFHIRKGIHFQDDPCFPGGKGREVTAADFVYAWRRMADPHLSCPVLSFVQDKVLGLDELVTHNAKLAEDKKPADYAFPLPGVEADPADPYAFRIRLIEPYPQLRYLMTMQFTTPIPHEAIETYGDEFARHPVGCGTFKMAEYLPHQRITLMRNPNGAPDFYPTEGDPGDREAGRLRDAGKPLPLLDKVVYVWTKEGVTGWNLFQQGYLDSYGVTPDNYTTVLQNVGKLTPEMERKGVTMQRATIPATYYFLFNMRDPVWGGTSERARKLRRAVSLCLDRDQWLSVMNQGLGKPADFLLPPGITGYDPDYHNPWCRHDIEEAKRLLAEAGYPGGVDSKTGERLTLPFDTNESGAVGAQQSRLIKQWIESIGIHVDVQTWQLVMWRQRIRTAKTTFFLYSWFADYPDPENFLQLLYGKNIGGINYAALNDPEYNRLFDQMRGLDNGPERMAIIHKMRAIAETECCWIPFYHPESISIDYPWVRNDKPHGMANDPLRYTAVDGAQRTIAQRDWNRPNYWPICVAVLGLAGAILPARATVNARRSRSVRRSVATGAATAPVTEPANAEDAEALASEEEAGT